MVYCHLVEQSSLFQLFSHTFVNYYTQNYIHTGWDISKKHGKKTVGSVCGLSAGKPCSDRDKRAGIQCHFVFLQRKLDTFQPLIVSEVPILSPKWGLQETYLTLFAPLLIFGALADIQYRPKQLPSMNETKGTVFPAAQWISQRFRFPVSFSSHHKAAYNTSSPCSMLDMKKPVGE